MVNTNNNNDYKTQVLEETAATRVANPAKRLIAEAGIGTMTKEQRNAFFEQMQHAIWEAPDSGNRAATSKARALIK